jgi:uncharacterized protein (DUF2384 family)
MTASECMKVFDLHHRLLVIYEPNEALMWLVTPQQLLNSRKPCELLAEKDGFSKILTVIAQITDSAYT